MNKAKPTKLAQLFLAVFAAILLLAATITTPPASAATITFTKSWADIDGGLTPTALPAEEDRTLYIYANANYVGPISYDVERDSYPIPTDLLSGQTYTLRAGANNPSSTYKGQFRLIGKITSITNVPNTIQPGGTYSYSVEVKRSVAEVTPSGVQEDLPDDYPWCDVLERVSSTGSTTYQKRGTGAALQQRSLGPFTASHTAFSKSTTHFYQGVDCPENVSAEALFKEATIGEATPIIFSLTELVDDTVDPTISGLETSKVLTGLTEVGTYTADEAIDTWSIESGGNGDLFRISKLGNSGVLEFLSTPTDGSYTVTIAAADYATNKSTKQITVTVGPPTQTNPPTIYVCLTCTPAYITTGLGGTGTAVSQLGGLNQFRIGLAVQGSQITVVNEGSDAGYTLYFDYFNFTGIDAAGTTHSAKPAGATDEAWRTKVFTFKNGVSVTATMYFGFGGTTTLGQWPVVFVPGTGTLGGSTGGGGTGGGGTGDGGTGGGGTGGGGTGGGGTGDGGTGDGGTEPRRPVARNPITSVPRINLSELSNEEGTARATTSPGQVFTLTGSGMNNVNTVNVGSQKAVITLKTATKLGFKIPKNLPAGLHDLSLYGSFGSMTEAKFFSIAKKKIKTRALGFAGNSPALSAAQKSEMRIFLNKLSGKVTLVCNGSTSSPTVTAFDRKLARDRATKACDYARELNPSLQTEIRITPAAGVGYKYRSVKLTLKNY